MTNFDRVQQGAASVGPYIGNASTEEALIDCLTDLLHFAKDAGENFDQCLRIAREHYKTEQMEEEVDTTADTEIMPRKAGAWKVYR